MFSRNVYGVNIHIVSLLIACIILIFLYGYIIRSTKTKDHLETEFYNSNLLPNIDGWSVTHFVFFCALGILYPNHHLTALMAGIGWEYIEQFLGTNKIIISGKRVKLVGEQKSDGTYDDDAYWYGKSSDMVVNILGYSIGNIFAPCPGGALPCKRR